MLAECCKLQCARCNATPRGGERARDQGRGRPGWTESVKKHCHVTRSVTAGGGQALEGGIATGARVPYYPGQNPDPVRLGHSTRRPEHRRKPESEHMQRAAEAQHLRRSGRAWRRGWYWALAGQNEGIASMASVVERERRPIVTTRLRRNNNY